MTSAFRRRGLFYGLLLAATAAGTLAGLGRRGVQTAAAISPEAAGAAAQTAPAASRPSHDAMNGITRTKLADGTFVVTSTRLPHPPREPRTQPDYAQGDWIIDNLGSEPSIITPYLEKDAYGSDVQTPVLESLITRDMDTFEWQPWLAEGWQEKPDHVTFVFTLRKEAKFSDGTAVTAADVVFSYNTMIDKDIDDARYKGYAARIQTCRALDDRTVEFKFKEPYFQALETAGTIAVLPEHIYAYKKAADYNNRTDLLVGSGPYVFVKEQWVRGQRIILHRNEKYWGPAPTFDRIQLLFIQNPMAAFQAFQNGDLDQFTPQPDQYEKFSKDPEFAAKFTMYNFERPNLGYRYIGWNEKNPMFADKETRQALTMLVDRKGIIETIQHGMGREITGPFPAISPQCNPDIKPLPYDVRAAKKKLADAGWKMNANGVLERNGIPFKFDVLIPSDSPVYTQTAETIKNQFARAGIIMTIAPFEFSVLVTRLDDRKFDAAMLGWTGGVEEDPYQIWHTDSIKDKGSNFISWSNKDADQLIEAGRREMDEAKRMDIWHKLHAVIAEEQPYTFLAIGTDRAFIQKRFQNTEPYKLGLNSSDWYVPKAQQKYH